MTSDDTNLILDYDPFLTWKLNEAISSPPPSSSAGHHSPLELLSLFHPFLSLMTFKRGIKRDMSAYPTLKDERFFESLKRSHFDECNHNDP